MTTHRPKDFDRISGAMLLRMAGNSLSSGEKLTLIHLARGAWIDSGVPWGGSKKLVADILRIINDKRTRDGRPMMDEAELRDAVRALLKGKRKEPLFEELSDALSNLREEKLGIRKIKPLTDDLKRTA
ncbi:hypothetical protein L0Y65_04505 [Candidatus Micrarchaeota archaeon]|nr:hypothetical protein [Candidatus Micrarchaeota archaeon]